MKRLKWRSTALWLATCMACTALSLAVLQGCGGGHSGGGGNGGASVVGAFSIAPASAIPGQIVTLQGVRLNGTDPVTIYFGDVSATIFSREGDAQVVVPVFLNEGGTAAVTPGGPVPVSVQIGDATGVTAANPFTVLPLPAAPGTTTALVAQIKGLGAYLEDMGVNGMLPLTTGDNPVLDRGQVVQTIGLARALEQMTGGADNPDSLLALINGTAPMASDLKLPLPVLDSVLAQSPALAQLKHLASQFAAIASTVEPTGVTTKSGRSVRALGTRLTDEVDFDTKSVKMDWSRYTPAQRIIVLIQNAQLIQSGTNALGFIDNFNTNYISVVGALVGAVPVPNFQGAAKLIQVESVVVSITSKLASAFMALVPSKFSKFYVIVSGTNRVEGGAKVTLTKGDSVPLDAYIVVTSTGGPIISPAGILGIALSIINPKIPEKIKDRFRNNLPSHDLYDLLKTEVQLTALEGSVNALLGSVTNTIDNTWVAYTGQKPPADYLNAKNLTINLPAKALSPFKINDAKTTDAQKGIVTIEALQKFNAPVPPNVTTNDFLSVTHNSDGSYTLKALKATNADGAGFFAALRDVKILQDAPSLREIALDSGVNVNVKGVVVIGCPNTRDADCQEPTPTPAPGDCHSKPLIPADPGSECGKAGGFIDPCDGSCVIAH